MRATLNTRTENRFAEIVRGRLLENKLNGRKPDSIRSLARAMAKGDPVRGETHKRSLFKWMAAGEPNPSSESRALVADALGLERGALDEDDEDSELPTHRHLLQALYGALGAALKTTEPAASLVKATAGSDSNGG